MMTYCPICGIQLELSAIPALSTDLGVLEVPGLSCPNKHYSHWVAGGVCRITVDDKPFQVIVGEPHVLMAVREKEIDKAVFQSRRRWLDKSKVARLE